MKRNFCRFLGVFLAVMMIAGMIPMTAFADGEELYDLWVGGERFSAEKTSVACGSGTAVYNADTATLTLTDAAITSVYEYKSGYEAMIYSEVPKLTIVLAGNNTMKSDSRYADGIDAKGGCDITVKGDGALTIDNPYYGTYIGEWGTEGGNLTVENGTLSVSLPECAGVWVNGDISVKGGSITVRKENESYNGMVSNMGNVTVDGGCLSVSSVSNALHFGNGDNTPHTLTVNGGEVGIESSLGMAVKVEPYAESAGEPKPVCGKIAVNGGSLAFSSKTGGTNVSDITIADGMEFAEGKALTDSGVVIVKKPDPVVNYPLYVNGVRFTSKELTVKCGSGTAVYDPATSTLTLDNASVTTPFGYAEHSNALIYCKNDINIVLKGKNEIKDASGKGAGGIVCDGSVTVKGDGSLALSDVYTGFTVGTEGGKHDLTFDGASVTVTSSSTGVWAARNITFKNSTAEITATGKFANAVISDIAGTVTVTNSRVNISAARAAVKLGDGDDDTSAHALVMNSGALNISSEKDYAVLFWNYRDPKTGNTGVNGKITVNGGSMKLSSANGGTNLPNEDITIAKGMGINEGESLSDSGLVVVGTEIPVVKYALWVNGKQFTSKTPEIKCGLGTASFDAETSTLTLDNAEIGTSYEYKERSNALIYSALQKLNIVIKGDAKLSDAEGKSPEGIVCESGNVSVKGGSLTVNGVYIGVRAGSSKSGSLTVDGTALSIESSSTGIWAAKNITFNNSEAAVVSDGAFANAVISNIAGTITVTNSKLDISAKRAAVRFGEGDNDTSAHAFVINAGEVNITSDKDYGILVWNYRDSKTGEPKVNGKINIKSGILTLNTVSGGTNLPNENVTKANDMYFTSGSSLSDSGEVVLKSKMYLKPEAVAEVPATCTESGVKAHYADGSAKFEDKNASKPVTDEQLVIPAKDHDWGEPVYVWSDDLSEVTATVTCKNDSEHTETETAKVLISGGWIVDCEHTPPYTYSAEFENPLFVTQTKSVPNPDGGHIWGEPVYEWAEDYSSVTASVTCERDNTHVESETVKTSATELRAADCENGGEVKYDAVFTDERFTAQTKTVETPALGHSAVAVEAVPASFTADGCEAYFKCEACGKTFLDEQCTQEITDMSALAIPALASAKLSKKKYVYDGKAKKPAVKVTDSAGNVISPENYTVSYSDGRKKVGVYGVTVTFSGKYVGTKLLAFRIVPKATSVKKLTAGKKKLTVSFKKQNTQITAYQIQYSLKKSFKSAKNIIIKRGKMTKFTITKLKSGKKYYVRIRTYKTVSGKKIYSAWSKTVNKKVK